MDLKETEDVKRWQEYPPGDLSDSGIKPATAASYVLAVGFFTTAATWEARILIAYLFYTYSRLWTNQVA